MAIFKVKIQENTCFFTLITLGLVFSTATLMVNNCIIFDPNFKIIKSRGEIFNFYLCVLNFNEPTNEVEIKWKITGGSTVEVFLMSEIQFSDYIGEIYYNYSSILSPFQTLGNKSTGKIKIDYYDYADKVEYTYGPGDFCIIFLINPSNFESIYSCKYVCKGVEILQEGNFILPP